jgi:hypothetical protein
MLVLGMGGCGTFSNYPDQVRHVRNAFADGDYGEAVRAMRERRLPAGDVLLRELELGVLQRAAGNLDESNRVLLKAAEIVREQNERALISVRDVSAYAATILINEKAKPYEAPLYERVLLHTILCTNFLLMGDLDGARVEVRQAYAEQKAAKEEYDKEIERTRGEAKKTNLDANALEQRVAEAYRGQDELLREAGNLYQNLYNYYVSSLVYEINGEYSDAYIDARTIYSQLPNFGPIRDVLPRYARTMGLRDDFEKWRDLLGESAVTEVPSNHGEIVLLFECGMAPVKEEIRFTFPIPIQKHLNLVTISLPKYDRSRNPVDAARLVVDGAPLGPSEKLMDVEAAAVRDLRDRAVGMALRHLIRSVGKVVLSEQVRRKWGDLAYISAIIAGTITEQADLRSWNTLPESLQAFRAALPEGSHDVTIELIGKGGVAGRVRVGTVEIRSGRLTVIGLRSAGVHGTANVVNY